MYLTGSSFIYYYEILENYFEGYNIDISITIHILEYADDTALANHKSSTLHVFVFTTDGSKTSSSSYTSLKSALSNYQEISNLSYNLMPQSSKADG